ncbi:MAG: MBL fold metallo-hydrolase [Roseiflexaceae bacterium]|nr:MBL fold metallo-hydrolase [Roseiflexaceae bacterium]
MFHPLYEPRLAQTPFHLLLVLFLAFATVLVGCGATQRAPEKDGLVTIFYEDGAQVEIISPNGIRVLVDVADPHVLSRPVTNKDILLTTHKHEDHYVPAFAKAFPGQQLNMNPGTITVSAVAIQGIASSHEGDVSAWVEKASNYIYVIETGGLRIVHFGDIGQNALTPAQLTTIGHVDVAFSQFANYVSYMSIINHKLHLFYSWSGKRTTFALIA